MRILVLLVALLMAVAPVFNASPAIASEAGVSGPAAANELAVIETKHKFKFSGYASVVSRFTDRDMNTYTPEPVFQGVMYAEFSKECSADLWVSQGLRTSVGREVDVGVSCIFDITKDTQIWAYVYRDFVQGEDLTEASVKVVHGAFDISVTQFFWDKNIDATRIEVGYTIKPDSRWTIRPAIVGQKGFGDPDILAGVVDIRYALDDHDKWYLAASLYKSLYEGPGAFRQAPQVVVSIGVNF